MPGRNRSCRRSSRWLFLSWSRPPFLLTAAGREKIKSSLTDCLSRTNNHAYPRCHLAFTGPSPYSWRDTSISPATDVCPHVAPYSALYARFPAPSAVHLTVCFLPGSQHPGLSGRASPPLSPHQRFTVFNCRHYSTALGRCQPLFAISWRRLSSASTLLSVSKKRCVATAGPQRGRPNTFQSNMCR